jgi:hypothetical protein
MKKILIATPSIDGKVESVYAVSLGQTMVHGAINNINFMPAILSKNSIIQIARNELLNYARDFNVDGMIWIDSDTGWEASWCTRLVQHGEDIVGGAVPRKEDIPSYTFRLLPDRIHIDSRGLMEIAGNGTAFMYMSRKVIDWLWDNSPPYDTLE